MMRINDMLMTRCFAGFLGAFALTLSACSGDDTPNDNSSANNNSDSSNNNDGNTNNNDGNNNTGMPDAGVDMDAGTEMDAGMSMMYENGLPIGTAPISRADTAFSVDPETGIVYMFFGDVAAARRCNFVQEFTAEGYFFDSRVNQWVPIDNAANPPPIRSRAGGIWDAANRRMIIFGGRYRAQASGPYSLFNDVWAYSVDNNAWENLTPSGPTPGPRNSFAQTQVGDQMIVFGGNSSTSGIQTNCTNDTWSFSAATGEWTQIGLNGTPPPARCFSVATADNVNGKVYVYGGQASGDVVFAQILGDLWELDIETDTWSRVNFNGPQPAPRFLPGLGYNPVKEELVMFAGHDSTPLGVTNELWTLDISEGTWTQQNTADSLNNNITDFCAPPVDFALPDLTTPERRQAFLFVVIGGKAYMYGGKTDCGIANDTWVLDLDTYEFEEINQSLTGMTCERSGQNCSDANAQYCG